MTRPETIVHDTPQPPYPIKHKSPIISGFGRGSSELGIPTANIPVNQQLNDLPTGIYYGWCKIYPHPQQLESTEQRPDGQDVVFNHGNKLCKADLTTVWPMVMSIGWNPFYHNKTKAAEIHIIHKFQQDFYGADLQYVVLGYIRPELNYTTKEALIKDIELDIKIAENILKNPEYAKFEHDLE